MNSVRNSKPTQTKNRNTGFLKLLVRNTCFLVMPFMIVACSDDSHPQKVSYELELTNLTHNQPFSPLAVKAHGAGYKAWEIGLPASLAIEQIAEAGDNTEFLGTVSSKKTASGTGIIGPGEHGTVQLNTKITDAYISAATMLVNTNDAFTGVTGLDLKGLEIGEQITLYLPVYDSGTEANSELTGTIPGPADGGTGFDITRDDVDFVAMHPGVVGSDDYPDSVLESSHRFDGPAALLKVRRLN